MTCAPVDPAFVTVLACARTRADTSRRRPAAEQLKHVVEPASRRSDERTLMFSRMVERVHLLEVSNLDLQVSLGGFE